MGSNQFSKTQLWTVYGFVAGAIAAVLLFALTGDIIWIVLVGTGLALGFAVGATLDRNARNR